MPGTARKTNPALWEAVKAQVTARTTAVRPASAPPARRNSPPEYQRRGGGYAGPKAPGNHLDRWAREAWGTRSGKASGEIGKRYLPRAACEAPAKEEYTGAPPPSGATRPPGGSSPPSRPMSRQRPQRRGTQRQGSRGIAWNRTSRRASPRISAPW
ncbi:hypothetical protein GCM10011504_12340 [Siccirubricoccus deserti]|nr:hypothetical protein GCM10011504_12340 [Siccirubricoccus deserti]